MTKLEELKKYLNYEFSSGSYTGEDYKEFERKYINYLKTICKDNGWRFVSALKNLIKNANLKISLQSNLNLVLLWFVIIKNNTKNTQRPKLFTQNTIKQNYESHPFLNHESTFLL